MVSTNDLFLIGGGLLAFLLLKERVSETEITQPISDFTRVQRINLEEIQAAETRKEQLENIRQQILGFEKAQAEQKISFIEEEIGKAGAFGSQFQAIAARDIALSRTAADTVTRLGSLEAAFNQLIRGNRKTQLQAGTIKAALEREQALEQIKKVEQFIGTGQTKIEQIRQEISELEQIV